MDYEERERVAMSIAGSAMNTAENDFGLSYEQVIDIMIEFDIEQCVSCGWHLYPGDYCTEHEHDEITCTDCCTE